MQEVVLFTLLYTMGTAVCAMGESVSGEQLTPYCVQDMGVEEDGFPIPLHPVPRRCNARAVD